MRESEFIDWIRSQGRLDTARVPVGPGDDCAVLRCGRQRLLVTADQLLDGVHFILGEHGPQKAGRKAMLRGLSDIAAMAGLPLAAVATVALPKGTARQAAEQIYQGLRGAAEDFACPLVGGDVAVWDQALAITVTVLARPDGIGPVLRSGARVGDAVCATGAFGGAWRSQRHLDFVPRIREARTLASRWAVRAMIDVSDGLARDLGHICAASGVGAELEAEAIPIHPDAWAEGVSGLSAALSDGEDYELLFALPSERAGRLVRAQPLDVRVSRIGAVVEGDGLTLVHPDGRRERLEPAGWQHET